MTLGSKTRQEIIDREREYEVFKQNIKKIKKVFRYSDKARRIIEINTDEFISIHHNAEDYAKKNSSVFFI